MNKRILALVLALVMMFCLVACGGDVDVEPSTNPSAPVVSDEPVVYVDPYADLRDDYDALSMAIYEDILGEYYEIYQEAKAAESVSERHALMALAEGKLLASGVMLPLTSNGGNYAISRVAPYTAPNALWGNDSYRYHNVVVVTEPITAAHRDEMKAKWAEIKGTGTYEAWAKEFLEEKGYTLKNSYSFGYSSDPQTWDVLATSKAADSEAIINTYDGLMEYDCEGTLQYALAESHTVKENADGTQTWTFKLKPGLSWVDSQGRKVADVKADDFVAGLQHMMDAAGGLEYLIEGIIVNGYEYNVGDVTDFSQVGVKAVDELTVEYTLCQATPFFDTMLGYGVFAPMSREYFVSQGGKFGAEYKAMIENADPSYTYGQTPNNIAYCGPYLVTNATAENTIVFSANPSYWNAENVNMKTLTWLFNDGSDELKAYNDTKAGVIDGAGLNDAAATAAKTDGLFDTLAYVSSCDATTFFAFNNLNRIATANFNDETIAVTPKDEEALERAVAAMYNHHFRLALCMAADRGAYNAQAVGEDLKLTSLRNTYTPGNFVYLAEEVTVEINGTEKTYPAGTYYGQIVQDQIDADGIKLTVWDPTAEGGIGSSDGFDGWYNADNAAAEMALAVKELGDLGLEISAENPIYIDLPYFSSNAAYTNRANAYKQSVESALGGLIIVNLVPCETAADIYYAGYYISAGYEANYDVYDFAGWGPDYGDPQTYLDTILPEYVGYMTMMLGIF